MSLMQLQKLLELKCVKVIIDQYKTNYKCLMPTNTFGPNDNYDL